MSIKSAIIGLAFWAGIASFFAATATILTGGEFWVFFFLAIIAIAANAAIAAVFD